jgi:ankyrin repeat protein
MSGSAGATPSNIVARACSVAFCLGLLLHAGGVRADDSLPAAIAAGERDAALELIAAGANIDASSADGTTALHWAAHRGDRELVRLLLEHGADATSKNDYGVTPISAAAVEGDYEIVAMLLDAGADVDSRNPEGQTALMAVARTGRTDTARLLLEHGAEINATEQWGGQSALMWAAAQGQAQMCRLLLEHGADVDAHGRMHDWQRRVTAEPRVKILNTGDFTPLLYAAREGCVECIDALIEAGADIDLPEFYGITPLILALLNRNFDSAARLVALGADVNSWDWWGRSPLFLAIDLNRVPNSARGDLPARDNATGLDVARMLLERGANANMRLKQQPPLRSSPNDRGSLDGSPDAFVIAMGATALHSAAKASDDEAVRLLLDYGADVTLANVFGVTPILAAAGVGHRYAVLRETPIRGAYKTGEDALATLKILLEADGANFDNVGTGRLAGLTAAHGAAGEGWFEVIELLGELGIDIDAANAKGETPRDLAAAAQHRQTVALLDELLNRPGSQARR